MPVEQITANVIAETFERAMQSHSEFILDDDVSVNVLAREGRVGGGRVRRDNGPTVLNMENNLKKDKNLVVPPLDVSDQMCLARCLVFGMMHYFDSQDVGPRVNRARTLLRNPNRWTEEAAILCGVCGVDPTRPCGTDELKKFEQHLQSLDFLIRVFAADMQNQCFFKEKEEDYTPEKKILHLVLVKEHYLFIRNINTYFGKEKFCEACNTAYKRLQSHRCPYRCEACKDEACLDRQGKRKETKCSLCLRSFYGPTCLQNHLNEKTQSCVSERQRRFCETCRKEYVARKDAKHVCGAYWCKVCKKTCKSGHRCYLQVHNFPKIPKRRKRKHVEVDDEYADYFADCY